MCASSKSDEQGVISLVRGRMSVEEALSSFARFEADLYGLFSMKAEWGQSCGFGADLAGGVEEYDPDEMHHSYPVRVVIDERLSPDVAFVLLRSLVRFVETRYGGVSHEPPF